MYVGMFHQDLGLVDLVHVTTQRSGADSIELEPRYQTFDVVTSGDNFVHVTDWAPVDAI